MQSTCSYPSASSQPNFRTDIWWSDIKQIPFFSRAERSYKIWQKCWIHVQQSFETFFEVECLKDLSAASDIAHFRCQCHDSFRDNDPPHNLKVVSGKIKDLKLLCRWPGWRSQSYFSPLACIIEVCLILKVKRAWNQIYRRVTVRAEETINFQPIGQFRILTVGLDLAWNEG